MKWRIGLDDQYKVVGFYPPFYNGAYPKNAIEIDEAQKNELYHAILQHNMIYDKASSKFIPIISNPPILEEVKITKKDEIAAARYAAETGGCTIDGVTIATDRGSQALLTAAVVSARLDPEFKTRWKCADGRFVTLDAMQLRAIGDAVIAHVEECFAREGELCELIDAAETPEELDAIQWSL